jgi:hypothetical protein
MRRTLIALTLLAAAGGPLAAGVRRRQVGHWGYGRWRRVPGDDGRLVGRYCSSGGGRAYGGQSSSGASWSSTPSRPRPPGGR